MKKQRILFEFSIQEFTSKVSYVTVIILLKNLKRTNHKIIIIVMLKLFIKNLLNTLVDVSLCHNSPIVF